MIKSPIDLHSCDEELFLETVVAYLEDAIEHSRQLLFALEAEDAHEVEERAHALKGASANICAGLSVRWRPSWNRLAGTKA